MDDEAFRVELERRLSLLEDPDSGEEILAPLPAIDLWLSVLGYVVVTVLMLWWGYFS